MSGLELTDQDGVLREDLPPIQRWLNRILAMKIAVQNAICDEFLTLVETRVSAAKEAGTFDIGVETVAVANRFEDSRAKAHRGHLVQRTVLLAAAAWRPDGIIDESISHDVLPSCRFPAPGPQAVADDVSSPVGMSASGRA